MGANQAERDIEEHLRIAWDLHPPAETEQVNVRVAVVWLREPIFYGWYKQDAEVEIADAIECVEWVGKLAGPGRRLPLIIDFRSLRYISDEARNYFAGPGPVRYGTACAIIIGSPISRVIGNFFLGVNHPQIPTRLFNTVGRAEEWAAKYVEARKQPLGA